ncbi:MAG: TrbG/VirB9 family P-type conjugative transfer protein, partial [Thiotrichaceae bacterium]|nr:TrbG/VirB9 family P-type conjugative transfer protein [Thiotrichaceae bacterium]
MNTVQNVFLISLCTVLLYGCQNTREIEPGNYSLAVDSKSGMQKTKYIPVPMPGQMMPFKKDQQSKRLVGEEAIEAANKKSIKKPNSAAYINSIMTFDYMSGALYEIYCAPLNITDIQFQNNEHIIATAAGDAIHWEVQKTYSGIGASRQEHLLIKPFEDDLSGSLVATTDQRTYHIVLHYTPKNYMASVKWRYPDTDGFLKQHDDPESDSSITSITNDVDVNNMDFGYQVQIIKGP